MGGPVSVVVANLVMEFIEGKILASIKFKMVFFKRFMGESVTCFPKNFQVYVLELFITHHPKIQFTMEWEKD